MSEPKYIIANIKLPIQIEDGKIIQTMSNNISIDFENCDKLPAISNNTINYEVIKNKLYEHLSSDRAKIEKPVDTKEIEKLFISMDELRNKTRSHRRNTSFKNKLNNRNRFTSKNYSSNSNKDVDSSQQPKVQGQE